MATIITQLSTVNQNQIERPPPHTDKHTHTHAPLEIWNMSNLKI